MVRCEHLLYICDVAERRLSLLSPSDEELGDLSAIQAQMGFRITAVTGHVLTGPSKGRENVTVRPVGRRPMTA